MSVVWILLALWSRTVGLSVAALVFGVPMNVAFVRQFRGTVHAKPGGTSLGLGRIAWLLIMTSTYLLGIATAIEFAVAGMRLRRLEKSHPSYHLL